MASMVPMPRFPNGGQRPAGRPGRRQAGFSMIELLVVISILLILAAMATPNIIETVANLKLRGSANTVSGLLQQARLMAVRDNKFYTVRITTLGSSQIAYIDSIGTGATDGSGNGSRDSQEPAVQLSGTSQFVTSGQPSFNTTTYMGLASSVVITGDTTLRVSFNNRGLPCKLSGSLCSTTASGNPVAFVYFLTDQRPVNGWAAVSVLPGGRVRVWFWDGARWE